MTTKWALATEKNSLPKPTKTTSVLFSNSMYHFAISHTVAFFIPKETQPILSQNLARRRHTVAINHRSRCCRHTVAIDCDASPQTLATFQNAIATLQTPAMLQLAFDHNDSNAGDASALIGDALVPIATLQFWSRRFNSRLPASFHPSQRRRFTPIATLQLSIAGNTSSFFFSKCLM